MAKLCLYIFSCLLFINTNLLANPKDSTHERTSARQKLFSMVTGMDAIEVKKIFENIDRLLGSNHFNALSAVQTTIKEHQKNLNLKIKNILILIKIHRLKIGAIQSSKLSKIEKTKLIAEEKSQELVLLTKLRGLRSQRALIRRTDCVILLQSWLSDESDAESLDE